MGKASVDRPPGAFRVLAGAVDPAAGGHEMRIAHDMLAAHGEIDSAAFAETKGYIDDLLGDPDTTNADLKGLLNRSAGPAWGIQFEFGADAKAARRYLEALSRAIAQELG